jgi:multidrug efflux pump subunit AcrA (membrane-fusion protein)
MNRKRISIYLICLFVFVVLIIAKQTQVRFKRNRPIVSIFTEWKEHGKPVIVHKAIARDVPVHTKVTAWPVSDNVFEAYVPRAIQQTIYQGQEISAMVDGQEFTGVISDVAEDISLDTGMYCVRAEFPGDLHLDGWVVAYVTTDTLHKVICIPNNIIERENEKIFIWKIQKKHAVKQYIKIGERNGYGAIVLEGLSPGDLIVYKGFTQLLNNDLVNVIESIEDPGE